MKETIERLWNDYLVDECAKIDTEEERELTQRIAELHARLDALLDKQQKDAIEKYVDALCDIEAIFAKKAFLKGCEFSVSFILESQDKKK